MAQFAFLAGQPGAFHDLLFALGQLQALNVDSHGNGGHGHQQGDRGKQQDFQAQLHIVGFNPGSDWCDASRPALWGNDSFTCRILRFPAIYAAAHCVVTRSSFA
ncbi:hypothetical protein G6F68_019206 [Rhizopus microsporus]|nr:hypothetical protein G6F68_019206 [Rhizopus microsporus]